MSWTGVGLPLRARDWEVRAISDAIAERLVMAHHYAAGASKTSTYVHGLLPAGALWEAACVGAALWMPPTKAAAVRAGGERWGGVLALSRLVVEPGAPGNAATFLMARAMRLVDRGRWPVLVTYADAWRGHTGAIYLATGWRYDGDTEAKAVWVKDGRMMSPKLGPRTLSAKEMRARGAELVGAFPKRRFVHENIPARSAGHAKSPEVFLV